jgi:tetratricopeptide (TPR) repeat protein
VPRPRQRPLLVTLLLIAVGCSNERSRSLELTRQAQAELKDKRYDAALIHFKEASELDPKNQVARYYIGRVYKEQQRLTEAIAAFKDALAHAPDDESLKREIADVEAAQTKAVEAVAPPAPTPAETHPAPPEIDALRKQIEDDARKTADDALEGLGVRGSGEGPRATRFDTGRPRSAPRVEQGKLVVRGSLDKEIIRRVVARHLNEVRFCYEKELMSKPELAGEVTVMFTISAEGSVVAAIVQRSTMNDAQVESCIAGAARRWEFPKPEGGGIVIVNYPFVLRAADADRR